MENSKNDSEVELPNYYAVIPANVRYSEELSPAEKIFFGEISALCNKTGCCWATNKYFAKLYKTSNRTISRWISNLANLNFIQVKLTSNKGSIEINNRVIQICLPLSQNYVGTQEKIVISPDDKNVNHNNLNILISERIIYIVELLNKKCNTTFKNTSQNTIKHITARINEGYTNEDFEKVIDHKFKEWSKDASMSQYLRPDTLFGTKFESYLQSAKKKESTIKSKNWTLPKDYRC